MEKILCPTDFSQSSRNAIEYARQLAQNLKAELLLFHNVDQPAYQPHVPVGGVSFIEPIPDLEEKKARETQVSLAREKLFSFSKEVEGSVSELRVGPLTQTLPQVIQDTKADVVVLGHEGLQDTYASSLTSEIIASVPCPVLLIPAHIPYAPPHLFVYATDLKNDGFTDVSFVLQMAAAFNAQVQFLHVLKDDAPQTRTRAEAALRLLCQRSFYPHVSYALVSDQKVEEGLKRFAIESKANLLVIGSGNKHFWQFQFLKDKGQDIAAHSFLPLLVLPHLA